MTIFIFDRINAVAFDLLLVRETRISLTREEAVRHADARHYLALAERAAGIWRVARRSKDLNARITAGDHLVEAEACLDKAEEIIRLLK